MTILEYLNKVDEANAKLFLDNLNTYPRNDVLMRKYLKGKGHSEETIKKWTTDLGGEETNDFSTLPEIIIF